MGSRLLCCGPVKWLRRTGVVVGAIAAVVALAAGILWWRLHQEPAELADTPAMNAAEAEHVLQELSRPSAPPPPGPKGPWNPRGGWGRKRPPRAEPEPRPYRLTLGQRQVAAIVVTQVARAAGGQLGDIRVAIRESDLLAAGKLRGTILSGSTVSIAAVPSAGRGGRLCLSLGEPRVGGQRIPSEVIDEIGGQAGAKMPRSICLRPRGAGLPGPVRAVRIANGNVVVDGVR